MKIEDINKALIVLDTTESISFEEPGSLKTEHFEIMALMYSHREFRDLLKLWYNNAVKSAALKSVTEIDMTFGKAEALTYKKILVESKRAFEQIEKLKKGNK